MGPDRGDVEILGLLVKEGHGGRIGACAEGCSSGHLDMRFLLVTDYGKQYNGPPQKMYMRMNSSKRPRVVQNEPWASFI